MLYLGQVLDVEAARLAGPNGDVLGQVHLDGNVDRFMVIKIRLEGDTVLARFLVGHQVELLDFQPGDQGRHIPFIGEDPQAVGVTLQAGAATASPYLSAPATAQADE